MRSYAPRRAAERALAGVTAVLAALAAAVSASSSLNSTAAFFIAACVCFLVIFALAAFVDGSVAMSPLDATSGWNRVDFYAEHTTSGASGWTKHATPVVDMNAEHASSRARAETTGNRPTGTLHDRLRPGADHGLVVGALIVPLLACAHIIVQPQNVPSPSDSRAISSSGDAVVLFFISAVVSTHTVLTAWVDFDSKRKSALLRKIAARLVPMACVFIIGFVFFHSQPLVISDAPTGLSDSSTGSECIRFAAHAWLASEAAAYLLRATLRVAPQSFSLGEATALASAFAVLFAHLFWTTVHKLLCALISISAGTHQSDLTTRLESSALVDFLCSYIRGFVGNVVPLFSYGGIHNSPTPSSGGFGVFDPLGVVTILSNVTAFANPWSSASHDVPSMHEIDPDKMVLTVLPLLLLAPLLVVASPLIAYAVTALRRSLQGVDRLRTNTPESETQPIVPIANAPVERQLAITPRSKALPVVPTANAPVQVLRRRSARLSAVTGNLHSPTFDEPVHSSSSAASPALPINSPSGSSFLKASPSTSSNARDQNDGSDSHRAFTRYDFQFLAALGATVFGFVYPWMRFMLGGHCPLVWVTRFILRTQQWSTLPSTVSTNINGSDNIGSAGLNANGSSATSLVDGPPIRLLLCLFWAALLAVSIRFQPTQVRVWS